MKALRYFFHVLQLGLIYAIYLMDDLYKNHLGFMRNVSFYSQKIEASMFGSKLFLLPLLLVVVSVFLIIKKRSWECLLLIILGILFLVWQTMFTLATTPIYYLVSGILVVGCLLQVINIFLKRS
ncbi:hypothetical protein [Enterococcus xiangfangensis]|uniref:Uncharacterized protein n=2 Tax=Enterococcus xiangfangensis TaxID=1296537 RepID=A0ABU3FCF6_9ENTE|nr:hypothetical protein [Enterococcus xiangfangensis]MDT2760362.1 hypothetical protein [Enterococcus xiangfangensis]